ncbi:Hypothetical predicted protein [Paramuricea clavata]|uniref:Uncharacterized protein n=1 Tax=Paramuricea clavata TaxID=317549 RepID=A0A7D9KP76_PARCT|nr:Hypothetical predicted protein [Paramuricea clavata]
MPGQEEETCKSSQTDCIQVDMVGCQTELTVKNMKDLEDAATSILAATKKQLCSTQLNEDAFLNDNEKTKFYTGLPNFTILMHVFNLLTPYIKSGTRTSLSKFQQFILVLMRTRLDALLQDLAYRFSISVATASRIFERWIDVMNIQLKFLNLWPEHEELRRTMPAVFKQNLATKLQL